MSFDSLGDQGGIPPWELDSQAFVVFHGTVPGVYNSWYVFAVPTYFLSF